MTGDWLFSALLASGVRHRDADLCVERAAIFEYLSGMDRRAAEIEAQHQTLGRVVVRPAESPLTLASAR